MTPEGVQHFMIAPKTLQNTVCFPLNLKVDGGRSLRNGKLLTQIDTVRDTAVKLASSEENSGLKIKKEKDMFVFELANDDLVCIERKRTRYRSGVVTDGGPHNAQTLDMPVPTTVLSTMP